jgi:hypothetical protein
MAPAAELPRAVAPAEGAAEVAERVGPAPVELGEAVEYVILAQAAISNVPTSSITGKLGLSPAAASYITGFALTTTPPLRLS